MMKRVPHEQRPYPICPIANSPLDSADGKTNRSSPPGLTILNASASYDSKGCRSCGCDLVFGQFLQTEISSDHAC